MLGVGLALISAICWGAGGVIFKVGLRNVSEMTGNFVRSIFAVLFLLPVIRVNEITALTPKLIAILTLSSFFAFFLGDLLYFNALKNSPVSYALPIASTYPVFVAILDNMLYGYAVTTNVILASLSTLTAIVLIPKEGGKFTLKSLTALFASFSWAISISTVDYLTTHISPVNLTFLYLLLNSAMLFSVKRQTNFRKETIIYMGLIGGFLSVVEILSFITSVKLIGSNMVSPISATSPVIGVTMGKIFLKERMGMRHAIAIVLVSFSVLLISIPI